MKRLNGKVAWVTGGASGIGLATTLLFAQEGARVVLADLDQKAGSAAEEKFKELGLEVDFQIQDVTDEGAWKEIGSYISRQYGKLDVLVNNAGIALMGSVEEATLDQWRRTMAVNLDGVFLGTQTAIRLMRIDGGSIVNVSSVEGIIGEPTIAAYNASKGGVRNCSRASSQPTASTRKMGCGI